MQNVEKLCLQWNDFKENVSSAFGELRGDRELTDVTLDYDDDDAQKAVLAPSNPCKPKHIWCSFLTKFGSL